MSTQGAEPFRATPRACNSPRRCGPLRERELELLELGVELSRATHGQPFAESPAMREIADEHQYAGTWGQSRSGAESRRNVHACHRRPSPSPCPSQHGSPGRLISRSVNASKDRCSVGRRADGSTITAQAGSSFESHEQPESPGTSVRTPCVTRSTPPRSTPAYHYAMCKKPPATRTRETRCATTEDASPRPSRHLRRRDLRRRRLPLKAVLAARDPSSRSPVGSGGVASGVLLYQ